MSVFQRIIRFMTKGHTDIVDITGRVERIVAESGIDAGIVNISGRGSTLAITTIEFEPGAVADLKRALEEIAPANDN